MARQGAEAVAVRLGSLLGQQAQAQLDGFKSRALRVAAPTQRHLYITKWRQIDVASGARAEVLVISDDASMECKTSSPRAPHAKLMVAPHNGKWAAVVVAVATAREIFAVHPLLALEAALVLMKTQATTAPAPNVWVLTRGSPEHAGAWGLSRSARAEASLPLVCMHTTATMALTVGLALTEPEAILHERKSCAPRLTTAPASLDGLVRLHFHARGAISNLFLEPLPANAIPPLGDAELLLRVRAVGLCSWPCSVGAGDGPPLAHAVHAAPQERAAIV